MLDRHWDPKFPNEHLLVVGCRHKSAVFLAEGEGVHGAEMLVIDLLLLAATHIVLHNLLVRATNHQDVGLVRMELGAVRQLAIREGGDALASLGVPELEVSIIRTRDEARTVRLKIDVAHRRRVAHVRAQALLRVVHVPDLDLAVHAR